MQMHTECYQALSLPSLLTINSPALLNLCEKKDVEETLLWLGLESDELLPHSLHSDPPIGTDVPTFTDPRLQTAHPSRCWSTLIGICRRWSSIPTKAKPAHLGRSSPTVVCLSWPTLVNLGRPGSRLVLVGMAGQVQTMSDFEFG